MATTTQFITPFKISNDSGARTANGTYGINNSLANEERRVNICVQATIAVSATTTATILVDGRPAWSQVITASGSINVGELVYGGGAALQLELSATSGVVSVIAYATGITKQYSDV